MELLITLTILPLVIGALSFGIIAVFSLNSSTSNRFADTSDSQVVEATYQNDVQSAGYITTDSDSSPQCGAGTGTQLMALESVPNQKTGDFQTVISYVAIPTGTTYSLERLYCTNGSTTPASATTLAFNLPSPTSATAPLTPPSITCSSGASPKICSTSGQQWTQGFVPAQDIATVTFNVSEPETSAGGTAASYNFVLAASPAASTSFNSGGVASTPAATCESTVGLANGPDAGALCFIDFSGLTQNDLAVAETQDSCYNMSVAIGAADILHFCLGISSNDANEGVVATALPSDTNAGLGNTVYAGVGGEPALYMNPYISEQTTLTMSLSGFNLVDAATGLPVTNWTFFSADAETTNSQESITWSSNNPLTVVDDADAQATQSGQAVSGNACSPVLSNGGTTATCTGTLSTETSPLTGAGMVSVSGTNLSSLTVNTNNYEALAFGMFLP